MVNALNYNCTQIEPQLKCTLNLYIILKVIKKAIDLSMFYTEKLLAVGVDNVFILLSAWRATNVADSLMHRMEETFSDAAVSITVTSLTDLISFAVGCLTPFPSVQVNLLFD